MSDNVERQVDLVTGVGLVVGDRITLRGEMAAVLRNFALRITGAVMPQSKTGERLMPFPGKMRGGLLDARAEFALATLDMATLDVALMSGTSTGPVL